MLRGHVSAAKITSLETNQGKLLLKRIITLLVLQIVGLLDVLLFECVDLLLGLGGVVLRRGAQLVLRLLRRRRVALDLRLQLGDARVQSLDLGANLLANALRLLRVFLLRNCK